MSKVKASENRKVTERARKLFDEHLPLVFSHVNKLRRQNSTLNKVQDDLEIAGMIGLLKACLTYNSNLAQFSTWATIKISSEVFSEMRMQDYLPVRTREKVRILEQGMEKLTQELNRSPTWLEIEERLKPSLGTQGLQLALLCSRKMVSLESSWINRPKINLWKKVLSQEKKKSVAELLSGFSVRERYIIRKRYWDEETLADIGKCLGVSRARIDQILKQIRQKLKKSILDNQAVREMMLTN